MPQHAIGGVIGMRGAKINKITSLSGASINWSGLEESARGGQNSDPDRIIRISGSTHAVTMAKSLITIALALELGRNRGLMEHESK